MKQNTHSFCHAPIAPDHVSDLRARAFAFTSVAPRAADVLRASLAPIPGSEIGVYDAGVLVGYVALWPLHVALNGQTHNITLLGPLMVDPGLQGCGLGADLMTQALDFVDAKGLPPVLLVGDIGYYQRFGFQAGLASAWAMPGLAAPERMLVRPGSVSAFPVSGSVLPTFAPPSEEQTAA